MDFIEQEQRNIDAIRRVDPAAISLIHFSNYVALFTFNRAKKIWEKTNIEGPFFIYKKFNETDDKNLIYSALITSRNSLEHFNMPIVENLQYKLRDNLICIMMQPSKFFV